jgi:type IV secretion system protein VirB10
MIDEESARRRKEAAFDDTDHRPRVGKLRLGLLAGGAMFLLTGLGAGIIWLTGGDSAPAAPAKAMSMAATPEPLRGLPTDYTQIRIPPAPTPPPPETKKEEEAKPAPDPEPRERIVYRDRGGGGGGGKSWRQEAQEADAKVVAVSRPEGSQSTSSGAPASASGAQQGGGRGAMYSAARLTAPFPLQVNARTPIRAHTEQPINTDAPGYVTAMVIGDIYTSDKSCVAFPHGSRIYGETLGEVKEGQVRVTTVWTAIQRPEPRNDTIELTRVIGGDADGTPGISGEVNNHWFKKFGFIAASSLIDLGTAALQGRGGGGLAVILGDSVAQNARSPLDEFAKRQLDIPPTIEVEPREISVVLSQHLPVDCFDQQ